MHGWPTASRRSGGRPTTLIAIRRHFEREKSTLTGEFAKKC